jgi:hypothetical protein
MTLKCGDYFHLKSEVLVSEHPWGRSIEKEFTTAGLGKSESRWMGNVGERDSEGI